MPAMVQRQAHSAYAASRRPTKLTLSTALVQRARGLGVNLSQAAEAGIARAVAQASDAQYAGENRARMEAWSAFFEEHGLPLAEHRQF
jgi:antitoxin CcdA